MMIHSLYKRGPGKDFVTHLSPTVEVTGSNFDPTITGKVIITKENSVLLS